MRTILAAVKDLENPVLVALALIFGMVKTAFTTYVFDDWKFAGFLFTMVVIDSGLGIFFAVRHKDLDPKAFGKFLEKAFFYIALLSVGHVMTHYTVSGEEIKTFAFIKNTIYNGMLIREAASILKFGGSRFKFLVGVLKYFRGFTDEGLPESTTKKPE
jgi:phage-related holin